MVLAVAASPLAVAVVIVALQLAAVVAGVGMTSDVVEIVLVLV